MPKRRLQRRVAQRAIHPIAELMPAAYGDSVKNAASASATAPGSFSIGMCPALEMGDSVVRGISAANRSA